MSCADLDAFGAAGADHDCKTCAYVDDYDYDCECPEDYAHVADGGSKWRMYVRDAVSALRLVVNSGN